MNFTRIVDTSVFVIWSMVVAYFLTRWYLHRKLVSLGIGAMAGGWMVVAIPGLVGWQVWREVMIFFKLGSVGLGIFVLWSIARVERHGR